MCSPIFCILGSFLVFPISFWISFSLFILSSRHSRNLSVLSIVHAPFSFRVFAQAGPSLCNIYPLLPHLVNFFFAFRPLLAASWVQLHQIRPASIPLTPSNFLSWNFSWFVSMHSLCHYLINSITFSFTFIVFYSSSVWHIVDNKQITTDQCLQIIRNSWIASLICALSI